VIENKIWKTSRRIRDIHEISYLGNWKFLILAKDRTFEGKLVGEKYCLCDVMVIICYTVEHQYVFLKIIFKSGFICDWTGNVVLYQYHKCWTQTYIPTQL